ncbi:MAG: tRNA 2-thiouridine(34) synthase MnmA [Elusimicrobiota bacterium]|nr:tRNA 2-thiouridine(34) synthase MnmA [Elusimicrobiota bacterium]
MRKKKIAVAFSGGVDSAVAAALLIEKGFDVIALNMNLFPGAERAAEDARAVAAKLNIPFYIVDCEKQFEKKVINYFCDEYSRGKTPNPCVVCNREIKFGKLLDKAKELGADSLATGHYARVVYDAKKGRSILKKAEDKDKDQSYFLFSLKQEQLKSIVFPLTEITKAETRRIAKKLNMKIHDKKESQEICFVNGKYQDFMKARGIAGGFRPGDIIDSDGNITGKHYGLAYYTIGQRKGIGAHGALRYVTEIDAKKNAVIIGSAEELMHRVIVAGNINWIDRAKLTVPLRAKVRIRYKHSEQSALIEPSAGGKATITFDRPQRSPAPGQAAVFYDGDTVLGGGIIGTPEAGADLE